jgi:miniconductance mechanosensitive channel
MFEKLQEWTAPYPWINNNVKFLAVFILAVLSFYFLKKIIIPIIRKIVKSTSTQIDDVLLSRKALNKISFLAPLIVIDSFSYLEPSWQLPLNRLVSILFALNFTFIITTVLTAVNELYEKNEKHRERPVKGYIQVIKIVVYIFGIVSVAGIIIGRSPLEIIAGLGVFTAILALLFRDALLSFVASIQISSYDLVRVGDWIEVSKYGADGEVIDISLTVIKVQNWDKTITTIPTYKLIEDSFKNWRGMRDSGVRRIKRSISLDQSSIKFCTEEMLNRFEKIHLITDYIQKKKEELKKSNDSENVDHTSLVNGRRLTNIGTFRAYLKEYLSRRDDLDSNYSFIVRQLASGPEGLPIEIYVFTNTIDFSKYEDIQADIFDHILAVIPQFELNIFQNPTGSDFRKSIKND